MRSQCYVSETFSRINHLKSKKKRNSHPLLFKNIDLDNDIVWENELLPYKVLPYLSIWELSQFRKASRRFLEIVRNTVIYDDEHDIWVNKKGFPRCDQYKFWNIHFDFRSNNGEKVLRDVCENIERTKFTLKFISIFFNTTNRWADKYPIDVIFQDFSLSGITIFAKNAKSTFLFKDLILSQKNLKHFNLFEYNEENNKKCCLSALLDGLDSFKFTSVVLGSISFKTPISLSKIKTESLSIANIKSSKLDEDTTNLYKSIGKNKKISELTFNAENSKKQEIDDFLILLKGKFNFRVLNIVGIPNSFAKKNLTINKESELSVTIEVTTLSLVKTKALCDIVKNRNFKELRISFFFVNCNHFIDFEEENIVTAKELISLVVSLNECSSILKKKNIFWDIKKIKEEMLQCLEKKYNPFLKENQELFEGFCEIIRIMKKSCFK